MNWVDLIVILSLIFFSLEGIGRPFILELLDFLSFLLAFIFSFTLYNLPAKFLQTQFKISHGLSLVLGFMITWFLSEAIFYLLAKLIIPRLSKLKIWGFEKYSFIPAFLRGLIFIALSLVLISTFPIQPNMKKAVLNSKIGSRILKYSYGIEAPVKKVFGEAGNDSLSFLTIKPKADEKIDLGFQTSEFRVDRESEKNMVDLVNEERRHLGIQVLVSDEKLQTVARAHSEEMFKRGYFSHYSPEGESVADRAAKINIDFLVIGENLAFAPTLDLAHKGLMNSKGHRENILSTDYKKIGIGVIDGGVYGRMFTQVFTD